MSPLPAITLSELSKLIPPVTPRDVIYGMIVPFAAALIAGTIAYRPWRRDDQSRANWPVIVGLAIGWLVAWIFTGGITFPFPPTDAIQWLAYAGAALLLLGVLDSVFRVPAVVRWPVALLACAGVVWLVTANMRQSTWTPGETGAWVAGLSVGMFVVWLVVDGLATRVSAATLGLSLAAVAVGAATVIGMSGSQSLGNRAGTLGVLSFGVAIPALVAPRASFGGVPIFFVPLWVGVMVAHHLYSYSEASPAPSLLLLAASPAVLWLGVLPPIARQPRLRRGLIRGALLLVPLSVAGGMVAVPFVRSVTAGGAGGTATGTGE